MRKWLFPLALSALPVFNGCAPDAKSPPSADAKTVVQQEPTPPAQPGDEATNAETEAAVAQPDLSNAPYRLVPGELTLPPSIRQSGPVADVIRLVSTGAEPGVLLGFITNAANPFNLTSDEIIYLNDLGVPSGVIEAMLQRDQIIKQAGPALALGSTAQPEMVPLPEPPPPTSAVALAPVAPPPPAAPLAAEPPAVVDTVDAGFYDALAPYGNWVDVEGCGPCWQPAVAVLNPGWQPYLNGGHWIYTDCGWYWLSGYTWGWAAFHYGRWFQHNQLGWCWAPDPVWAPAWVSWRNTGSYCGWAPLPPGATFSPGVGLTYYGRPVSAGFHFGLNASAFVFVHTSHFLDHHVNHFLLPSGQADHLFPQTSPMTSLVANAGHLNNLGIPPAHITSVTRSEVRQVALRDEPVAKMDASHAERLSLGGGTLAVFRPDLTASPRGTVKLSTMPIQKSSELAANYKSLPQELPDSVQLPSAGRSEAMPAANPSAEGSSERAEATREPEHQPAPVAQVQTPAPPVRRNPANASVARLQRQWPWMASPSEPSARENGFSGRSFGPRLEPANRPAEARPEPPRYSPPPQEARHEQSPPPPPASSPPPPPAPRAERGGR